MPTIHSDDPDVERQIEKICALLVKAGGTVSDNAILESVNGSQRILAKDPQAPGPLLTVPHAALIAHENFRYAVEKGDIVIKTHSADAMQVALAGAMVYLYNMSGKLGAHRDSSPWVALLEHPEILRMLAAAREGGDTGRIGAMLRNNGASLAARRGEVYDRFVRMTFFKTRLLGCRFGKADSRRTKVMMPVADFINHHYRGAPFVNDYECAEGARLGLTLIAPVEGSNECFACYGRMDALDSYLHYGFVDLHAPFVRSVPVTVDFGAAGLLRIGAENASVSRTTLSGDVADLHYYMPVIKAYYAERIVEMSHIMIPPVTAPRSMRRVLELAVRNLGRDLPQEQVAGMVLCAEEKILLQNEEFYMKMKSMVDELTGEDVESQLKMVSFLCGLQMKRLETYKDIDQSL